MPSFDDRVDHGNPTRDERLEQLLAVYIAAEEAGEPCDRQAMLTGHADLAPDLEEFFANRDRIARVVAPLRNGIEPKNTNLPIRYFGDYELLETIASGGMGIVFKARQVTLNRVVAVKMILAGSLANKEDVQRFRAEAEAAANLKHPGIVPIYEVGLHEGQHYFSMEFIEGRSLADLVRDEPCSARLAAEYVHSAAETVQYAHEQGTLHRDLKPSNMLIDQHGRLRITDFGLAKRISDNSDLTQAGQALGTPAYMPPEQAAGQQSLIGPRGDVYALGAVLYELLTGRPPFCGESALETLKLVEFQEPVSPRLLNPAVPRDLETISLKCLEKEPSKRYLSAQALADDVGRYLRGETILARPVSQPERVWRWCRRNPVVATLTIASVVLAFLTAGVTTVGYVREARLRQDAETSRSELAKTVNNLTHEQSRSQHLRQDVRHLETRREELNTSLKIGTQKLIEGEERLSHTAMQLADAAWNAENVQLAEYYLSQCPTRLRDAEWADFKKKCHPDSRRFNGQRILATSGNGQWLAGAGKNGDVRIWNTLTGELAFTLAGHEEAVTAIDFSHDCRWLASGAGSKVIIWTMQDGTKHQEIATPVSAVTDVRFSPDDRQLAAACSSSVVVKPNTVRIGTVIFWDTQTFQQQFTLPGMQHVVFNHDGSRLATIAPTTADVSIWALPPDHSAPAAPALVIEQTNIGCRPAFHPSRDELAISCLSRHVIEVWDVATERVLARIPANASADSLAFSGNGRRLAFASTIAVNSAYRPDSHQVLIWNLVTHRRERILPWYSNPVLDMAFSSDGNHLATADAYALVWWDVSPPHDPTEVILADIASMKVGPRDWPQWGGSPARINTPLGNGIPEDWDVGRQRQSQLHPEPPIRHGLVPDHSRNIKWSIPLGSQSYGNPVVANGRVFVGTNNGAGYSKRFPSQIDLGVLLCFDEQTGNFLWQHSNEKLPTGRVNDWPLQGVCSTPSVDGDRVWYVSNRGEVICLDANGFYDDEDDGIAEEALLRIPSTLHESLPGGGNSWLVRAIFADAGVALPDSWVCRSTATASVWRILTPGTAPRPLFEIMIRDERLEVRGFDGEQRRDELLFDLADGLTAGLDLGQLPRGLRAILLASGVAVSSDTRPVVSEPGKHWQLTAMDGASLTLQVNPDNKRLTVSYRLTTLDKDEADVVWKFNMMTELGTFQHNMANCSVLAVDGRLFVCTSNGVDEGHVNIPSPAAPSFIALDQKTGRLLWQDNSPGANILHAQWGSPSYGVFGGVPQVLFAGGDGWLYSFDPAGDGNGKSRLLWKFDCNPKESFYRLGTRSTRNDVIAFPAIYNELVYIVTGQDPEHGEGVGNLWCIDPAGQVDGGDLSAELAVDPQGNVLPVRRNQAVSREKGERAIPNPKSAVVWNYSQRDQNGDGKISFEEEFHRSLSTPVIKDGILYVADYSGLFHCLNAKTGKVYWTYDLLAACWNSALLVDGKVFIADEDGDVAIFRHSTMPRVALNAVEDRAGRTEFVPLDSSWNPDLVDELNMGTSVYMTPVVANDVLFIATKDMLYAISRGVSEPLRPKE